MAALRRRPVGEGLGGLYRPPPFDFEAGIYANWGQSNVRESESRLMYPAAKVGLTPIAPSVTVLRMRLLAEPTLRKQSTAAAGTVGVRPSFLSPI